MKKNDVPAAVLQAAAGLVDMYGERLRLLGERDGTAYYLFEIPSGETTGFPFVYTYKDGLSMEISDFAAVRIMRSFGIE